MRTQVVTREECRDYINRHHRHHGGLVRDKYRVGAVDDTGALVGVVQVGNPVARGLCDGVTLEVTRLCTDGTPNACTYLLGVAARIARDMGYHKIVTYILDSEHGTSLRAAGWEFEGIIKGKTWDTPARPRTTTSPICDKGRWSKQLVKNTVASAVIAHTTMQEKEVDGHE